MCLGIIIPETGGVNQYSPLPLPPSLSNALGLFFFFFFFDITPEKLQKQDTFIVQ